MTHQVTDVVHTGWERYIHYSIRTAIDAGWIESGVNLVVTSSLRDGAGISSSAAICVAVLKAIRQLNNIDATDIEIARMAKYVENQHIGVPCGIMDQMAVSIAAPGQALFLNTRTLDYRLIDLPLKHQFVVLHSGIERQLSDGRYQERKEECDIAKHVFGTVDLCMLTESALNAAVSLDSIIAKRVRHCITENNRTIAAADALQSCDMERFGELMNESHASMRDDFEVSVSGIDRLVEAACEAGAIGARLTGGGFGGCIVACVEAAKVERWVNDMLTTFPDAQMVN